VKNGYYFFCNNKEKNHQKEKEHDVESFLKGFTDILLREFYDDEESDEDDAKEDVALHLECYEIGGDNTNA